MRVATLVGGLGGLIVFGGLDRRIGLSWAIVALVLPGLLGARLFRRASRDVSNDLDRFVEELSEDAQLRATAATQG